MNGEYLLSESHVQDHDCLVCELRRDHLVPEVNMIRLGGGGHS